MNSPRTGRIGILVAAILALIMLTLPGGAAAKDRNRDRIPDRWEKQHRLSLHKNQRKLDQDRDGLKNRGEWLAGTSPRDRDSDDDGTVDGKENAGFVATYDTEAGTLTITLYGGGEISGSVNAGTEVECDDESADDESGDDGDSTEGQASSRRGSAGASSTQSSDQDESGDDNGSDDESEDESEDSEGEEHDGNSGGSCSLGDLATGVIVHEADLSYRAGGAVFTGLEIEKPVVAG